MKAARLHPGSNQLIVEEIDIPRIGSREVLIKNEAAGVCHTDLHFLDGIIPVQSPMTLGHEIAGRVAKVGSEVSNLKEGDRVIVNNCVPCNACPQCLEGRDNLCDNLTQLGFNMDGGYAEFVRVRSDSAIPLPHNLSFKEGSALTCGVAACYHAMMDIANLTLKDTILINGTGGLGFSALQIAKVCGARTIAVDVVKEKLDLAKKEFGADYVINGNENDVRKKVKEFTDEKGVDVVLELVGIPKTMSYGIDVLSKTGRIVFVGYSKADFVVSPLSMILKEAKVLSSLAYRKSNLIAVRDLASKGRLKPLIGAELRLENINEALDGLKTGKAIGRSMVVF